MNPEMLQYVTDFIETRDPVATKLETKFRFRRLADHCFRCHCWAQRLQAREGGDAEVAAVAALFHDIGKCVDDSKEGHARAGATICREYLDSIHFDGDKAQRICEMIGNHIHHRQAESIEAKIVSDADLLDEVGALAVLWDALAVGAQEEQSYRLVYERLLKMWRPDEAPRIDRFHTETARQFYLDRKAFFDRFMRNLEFEQGLREEAEP